MLCQKVLKCDTYIPAYWHHSRCDVRFAVNFSERLVHSVPPQVMFVYTVLDGPEDVLFEPEMYESTRTSRTGAICQRPGVVRVDPKGTSRFSRCKKA
uniref:Uncharacterized protein n=1 Tax=Anopheles quadriannulatus TaxID=34691 RepID=A0A182XNW2_ANOQN